MKLLKKAYLNSSIFEKQFNNYKKNTFWLKDYAMFMVLKEHHNNVSWDNWDDLYKYRNEKALKEFYKLYKAEVEAYMFMQFLYNKQWKQLLKYAHSKNIKIVGDMPIYVAYDSVDVWKNPELFMLDQWLKPTVVAGVPPDYFSETGQLWGNPIYNYDAMKKDNYLWWNQRIGEALKLLDYVRIDHFRGFSAFYTIPFGMKDARIGTWIKGPGMDLFSKINENFNNPNIIAENLGLLDDDVNKLIEDTTYPGMKILEFEMYSKDSIKALRNINPNNILYPGTHDNNTFVGWYNENASYEEKQNVNQELGYNGKNNLTNCLIKYCYQSNFDYVIIMMQDVLGLDSSTRFNMPGSSEGNWQYKFKESDFTKKVSDKLASYKEKYIK